MKKSRDGALAQGRPRRRILEEGSHSKSENGLVLAR
jgi:hypothetical protein